MDKTLRVGIAGLGHVGADVFRLLHEHADLLSDRTHRRIVVTAVSARDKTKDRGIDLSSVTWHDDPAAMAGDDNVDLIVELMGGAEGAAFDLVKKALEAGKSVVTANKALVALRAPDLLSILENGKGAIAYEAAVAGGVPVIKGLREGLTGNEVRAVYGILNGTCNYILSEMTATGRDFEDVLKEAQAKGYAEADPSFDVDGIDTGHKTAILAGIAFGCVPDFKSVSIEGIRGITPLDIQFADELGFRIKLLGIARQTEDGIAQSVEPCLVPKNTPVANVEGPLNAVYVDGDYVEKVLFVGAGAGGRPTASAVVADIVDMACDQYLPLMGTYKPAKLKPADMGARIGSYYLRLNVLDKPGVIADVSAILRDNRVSLETVLQRGRDPGQPVQVILTTHESTENAIKAVTQQIAALDAAVEPPHVMRIEGF
ncbi:MAG: homoserine dehydrogenase [Alphaproteobacteria bacterium]|nr:homoserine dehydrogenase [Alphaproteobacteria bacterium]